MESFLPLDEDDAFLDLITEMVDRGDDFFESISLNLSQNETLLEIEGQGEEELLIESRLPSIPPTELEASIARKRRVEIMRERKASQVAHKLLSTAQDSVPFSPSEATSEPLDNIIGTFNGGIPTTIMTTTTTMNTDALLHPNTSTKSAKKVRQTKASTWDGTGTLPIAQMSEEQLTHALESMPELPKGSSKEEKVRLDEERRTAGAKR